MLQVRRKFVTRNMWHSCGQFSMEALFARSEPNVFQLYKRIEDLLCCCGQVTVIPQKTRIVFQVRVRFLGVVPRKSYLQCGFGFARRNENARFYKIEQYAPRWFSHHCKIERYEQLDDEFMAWIEEAYNVGKQMHVTGKDAPS